MRSFLIRITLYSYALYNIILYRYVNLYHKENSESHKKTYRVTSVARGGFS